jgi:hypothetical protein
VGAEADEHVKVSELAAQLQLPASVVLEQCLRLGIDATWAGADLAPADVAILEAELAHEDPSAHQAPAAPLAAAPLAAAPSVPSVPDAEPADEPVGGSDPSDPSDQPVPPTAVGSMPEMTDSLMRDAADNAGSAPRTFAGRDLGSADGAPPSVASDRSSGRIATTPHPRRIDAAIRPGVIALVLAAVALVGSNTLDEPFLIALLWVFAFVALVTAILSGNRARYRITTHPEQRSGLLAAVVILVAGVVGLAGLIAATVVTVRDTPAADAPLGIGDLNAVDKARWGYRRLTNVASTGWERPAKDAETCWEVEAKGSPRRDERVELGGRQVSCDSPHGYEVLGVFAVNRDADAPYPGEAELTRIALARCAPKAERIKNPPADFRLLVEYPTEAGWVDGDHDVACVAFAVRETPLRD